MRLRHWPLNDLVIRTPRLELRLPAPEELDALGDLAAEGVHDPGEMPFVLPWTDASPEERARGVFLHHWRTLGAFARDDWQLPLAVFTASGVVGIQEITARDFAETREVRTGSWLGLRHQGQGIGTEMRAAVLHLAFTSLGAEAAHSAVVARNPRSLRVSRRLGYRDNGVGRLKVRGQAVEDLHLRLERADWRSDLVEGIEVHGVERCLPLLGAGDPPA
ncbi:GNAT family N-acetyltransferase [Nocardiopsis sediminis]|uniref:GNAT family N-acetyltransferase n=1 Tax=Nocardiopsis sediminis TaxID=1778267 RepID=A0ABV8FVL3_9ACTN